MKVVLDFIYMVTNLYVFLTIYLLFFQVEDMVRPLIFPLWLPKDDVYRTPNYEAFMVLEIVLLAVILTCFGGLLRVCKYILELLMIGSSSGCTYLDAPRYICIYNILYRIFIILKVRFLDTGTIVIHRHSPPYDPMRIDFSRNADFIMIISKVNMI